jgi:hypothetical protein
LRQTVAAFFEVNEMHTNRFTRRVLAAAVALSGVALALPASADTFVCTAATFQATPDSSGKITANPTLTCTSSTSGVVNPPPPPPPPPPPSGSVAEACAAAGYNNVQVIEMAWADGRYFTKGFSPTGVAVFHFRTPGATSPGNKGRIAGAENSLGPKLRHAVLSATPCDFGHSFIPYNYSDQVTVSVNYFVGGDSSTYLVLQPARDYYLNVKNDPKSCTSAACDMYMDFVPPAGL